MPKFYLMPTTEHVPTLTVRVGTVAAPLTNKDLGKPVKLGGDSQYIFCAVDDAIEGFLESSQIGEQGTVDGFAIGGIKQGGYILATAETIVAVGDYVVAGAVVATATALTKPMGVKKAAVQADAKAAPFRARVESLHKAGTGAVGTIVTLALY